MLEIYEMTEWIHANINIKPENYLHPRINNLITQKQSDVAYENIGAFYKLK